MCCRGSLQHPSLRPEVIPQTRGHPHGPPTASPALILPLPPDNNYRLLDCPMSNYGDTRPLSAHLLGIGWGPQQYSKKLLLNSSLYSWKLLQGSIEQGELPEVMLDESSSPVIQPFQVTQPRPKFNPRVAVSQAKFTYSNKLCTPLALQGAQGWKHRTS